MDHASLRRERCLALAVLSVLSACALPRPEGSYEPDDFAPAEHHYEDGLDAGDASLPVPHDAGPPPVMDDAATTLRLLPLAGSYLVRIDGFARVTSKTLLGDVVVRSRASQLLVTRLTASQGKLVAQERLCHQTAAHHCDETCTSFRSEVLPSAIAQARVAVYPRSYEVDDAGRLTTSKVTMQLGYTDQAHPDLDPPSTPSELVWDLSPDPGREGMLTKVDATATLGSTLQCYVFNTQRFVSSFAGSLNKSALDLEKASLTVDTEGGAAEIVGAGGPNARDCAKRPAQAPTVLRTSVRFARTDPAVTELACPEVAEFDRKLPADAPDSF